MRCLIELGSHFGRFTGKCVVDNTEKGWFVKYIERDPEELARQDSARRRDKVELDDEERTQKAISEQVQRALEERPTTSTEYTELQRDEDQRGNCIYSANVTEH